MTLQGFGCRSPQQQQHQAPLRCRRQSCSRARRNSTPKVAIDTLLVLPPHSTPARPLRGAHHDRFLQEATMVARRSQQHHSRASTLPLTVRQRRRPCLQDRQRPPLARQPIHCRTQPMSNSTLINRFPAACPNPPLSQYGHLRTSNQLRSRLLLVSTTARGTARGHRNNELRDKIRHRHQPRLNKPAATAAEVSAVATRPQLAARPPPWDSPQSTPPSLARTAQLSTT